MKRLVFVILLGVLAYIYAEQYGFPVVGVPSPTAGADSALQTAFEQQKGGVQVKGEGTVVKILQDDREGSRHQRFILRLDSGQTVLIAHNIDLARRIRALRRGDRVEFFGEYEWNEQGGVIHWTHRDPKGLHVAGWLKHLGDTYQ